MKREQRQKTAAAESDGSGPRENIQNQNRFLIHTHKSAKRKRERKRGKARRGKARHLGPYTHLLLVHTALKIARGFPPPNSHEKRGDVERGTANLSPNWTGCFTLFTPGVRQGQAILVHYPLSEESLCSSNRKDFFFFFYSWM